MSKKSFAIPVHPSHIRKLQDPTDARVARSVGYCTFEHLPFTVPMDPNPRKPTEKSLRSGLAKDIRQTALETLGLFHLINAGIFILAFSSFANLGLLVRERVQLLPFFLILICIPPPVSQPVKKPASG